MSWDDNKAATEDILSADWNAMVAYIKTISNVPYNNTGADCTLSDGLANRVLTLANTTLTRAAGFMVFVGGLLQHSSQITVVHKASGTTVTFTDKLWDADKITTVFAM